MDFKVMSDSLSVAKDLSYHIELEVVSCLISEVLTKNELLASFELEIGDSLESLA